MLSTMRAARQEHQQTYLDDLLHDDFFDHFDGDLFDDDFLHRHFDNLVQG